MNPQMLTLPTHDIVIAATDGYPLAATVYSAEEHPQNIILINSGTGVKRQFYAKFARFLVEQGFTVVTYDYRGIGESLRQPLHTFDTSMHEWGEKDVVGAIAWVMERFGKEANVSVVGHSAGGKILGLAHNNNVLTALVTVAVPNSFWQLHSPLMRLPYALLVHAVMPTLSHLLSYFPAQIIGLGEDYPKSVALEWARWSRYRGYIRDPKGGHTQHTFETFRGAILAYSFEDDLVASGDAVESLMNFYTNASERTHRHIIPNEHGIRSIGHSGFFRETSKPLWYDLVAWLRRQHGFEAQP